MRNRRICIALIFSANLILETPPIVSVSPGVVVQNYFCHCPGGLSPGSSRNLVTTEPMILRTERNQRIAGAPTLPLDFDSLSPKRTQLASLFVGLAVSMLLVFGLSGCAPSTEDQISTRALIESTPPTTPPTTSDGSVAQQTTSTCEPSQRTALQRPISEQLLALNRGDFAAARDQASPSFKAVVDIRGFEEMVRSGFPFLLDQSPAAFGRCRITNDTASVEVRFRSRSPIALVYFLVKTQEEWRIEGASPAVDSVTERAETS